MDAQVAPTPASGAAGPWQTTSVPEADLDAFTRMQYKALAMLFATSSSHLPPILPQLTLRKVQLAIAQRLLPRRPMWCSSKLWTTEQARLQEESNGQGAQERDPGRGGQLTPGLLRVQQLVGVLHRVGGPEHIQGERLAPVPVRRHAPSPSVTVWKTVCTYLYMYMTSDMSVYSVDVFVR